MMDIHASSLALVVGGHTGDPSILSTQGWQTGTYPFIQMHSGNGMLYVWSKAFQLPGHEVAQISFNTNGKLVAAATHSLGNPSDQRLLLLRSADGILINVLTSGQLGILSKNNLLIFGELNTNGQYPIYVSSIVNEKQVQMVSFSMSGNATVNSTWAYMTDYLEKVELCGIAFGTNESQQIAYFQYSTTQGEQRKVLLLFQEPALRSYQIKTNFTRQSPLLISKYDQYVAMDSSMILKVLVRQMYYAEFQAYKYIDDEALQITGLAMPNQDTLAWTYFRKTDGITFLARAYFTTLEVNQTTILPKFSGQQMRGYFDNNMVYYSGTSGIQYSNSNVVANSAVKIFPKMQGIIYSSNETEACYTFATVSTLQSSVLKLTYIVATEYDVVFPKN